MENLSRRSILKVFGNALVTSSIFSDKIEDDITQKKLASSLSKPDCKNDYNATSGLYNNFAISLLKGASFLQNNNFSDIVKVALMNDNHLFNIGDDKWSDVRKNEISGEGYKAGGKKLVDNKLIVQNNGVMYFAQNTTWKGPCTFAARHAVIYNETTGELIASIDFGKIEHTSILGDFTIAWPEEGIFTWTCQ